ncbi:MAG TPA: uroporphyrinogen decarboxylase family protein [Aggregatilinea sp.]|uniref:uroporphyrinogen decarboxylase family protein n=1 Tax=Aggregatilinea sp. TaxID=2806333 RepID=UPI002CE13901|nr:uroporphyrinogen decarboxylase family protein [Aggregatilinea sp.]HML20642.1 uroporphyrinogen decarboxylase family protein [Aggregatilinea sp.]
MADVIEIAVPFDEIEARRERVEKAKRFETPDRVPVIPAVAHRVMIPRTGISFRDYYRDPETMLRAQILGQKWLLENVRTDSHSITGAWAGAWTDFQNTFEAGSLGVEIHFPDDDIPWVGEGWVKDDADLPKLEAIDYVHTGINARQVEFRRRMIEVADKYPVRFQGGPVFYPGANPWLTNTSDGPFGVTGDVMGQVEAFTAVYERPDFLREVMRIVTGKMIEWLDFCVDEMGLERPVNFAWTDDLAVSMSAESFREFALPFNQQMRYHFDGRASLHMCGRSDHLLEIFRDDLKIDEFQGFGYQVNLDRVAEVMGGRVVLIGNVNPMLIQSGTPDDVREATRRVIEKLKDRRGLIIQDGSNIPPDAPLENVNAMMEAAELYGRYD